MPPPPPELELRGNLIPSLGAFREMAFDGRR